jgi:hypothetical protein
MKPIEENGTVWRYRTTDNEWTAITLSDISAPFPSGRRYDCITSDGVDEIYIHSGCPEQGRLSDVWMFDLVKRSWTVLTSAPDPGRVGPQLRSSTESYPT